MDNVESLSSKHIPDTTGENQSWRYRAADNGATGMNRHWSAKDDDISIFPRFLRSRRGSNNLHLMAHAGEIFLKTGDMDIHPTSVSIIVRLCRQQ